MGLAGLGISSCENDFAQESPRVLSGGLSNIFAAGDGIKTREN